MNEIQIFNHEQFGQVRMIDFNGEPWAAGKDVATGVGYKNPLKAIRDHVDDEDKMVNDSFTVNGTPIIWINESGIHSLVLSSKLESAKKFKRWVTSEVLPSIRKHGMYATPQTAEKMLNDPDFAIRLFQEIKAERQKNAVLEAKKNELEAKIEEDRPMTEFGLVISTSEGCVSVAQLAAMLCQKGVDTGEHRLFAEMREDGFLNKSGSYYNKPAQKFLDNKTMEYKVYKNKYTNQVTFQPLITPKGIQYFMDYYLRKHGKLPLLTVHRRTVIEKRPNYRQQSSSSEQVKMSDINSSI